MESSRRANAFLAFVVVTVVVIVIAAGRMLLGPLLGDQSPLTAFVVAVAFAAALGGFWAGLYATLLSTFVGMSLFIPLGEGFLLNRDGELALVFLFVFVGVWISLLNHRLRRKQWQLGQSLEAQARLLASEQAAHAELRHANSLLQAVVESTPDLIFAKDRDNNWIFANNAALRVLNKTAGEVLGRNEQAWHPDPVQARVVRENDRRIMENGQAETVEEAWTGVDGVRIFSATKVPLRDAEGRVQGTIGISRDVTERHQLMASLRAARDEAAQERRRLEAVLQALPVGVFIAASDGRILMTNRAADEVWGGIPETASISDYAKYRGFHAKTGEPLSAHDWALARALRTCETVTGSVIDIERFDGRRGTVLNSAAPILGPEGRIEGGVVAMSDITALKAVDERLRVLAAVVEGSGDFIGICTPCMTPTYLNPAGRAMVGLLGAVEDTTVLDFFWPEDRERVEREAIPALRANGRWVGEVRFRHFQTGECIHTLWNAFVVRDEHGRPIAWATISPSLNLLKATEEALRTATLRAETEAARLQAVFDAMQDPVIVYDAAGDAVRANPAAVRAHGFDPTQCPFERMRDLVQVSTLDGAPHRELPSRRALRGESVEREIGRISTPAGGALVAEITASPLRNGSQVVGALLVWHDVTERQHWEESLEKAKSAAEEANLAKSRFLAMMSHEIRTPLNAILGFSELLRDAHDERTRRRFLDVVMRNGRLLNGLIGDILDLSRIEADAIQLESGPVKLEALFKDVLAAFPDADRLTMVRANPLPAVILSDETRLRQAVLNLVGNAIKFSPAGTPVQVRVSHDARNRLLQFEVEDAGIGIAAEDRDRLFESFQQANPGISRHFGGTGLGLALSRRLARLMGGDLVLARTELGKGSVFLLTVAAYEPSGGNADKQADQQPKALGGLRVLLAEDKLDAQLLMQTILELQGAAVTVVDNGVDAIQRAFADAPDVILMDVMMPRKDGLQATRELRARGFRKPIVALTAFAMDEEREKSIAAGCTEHLTKPIRTQQLIEKLHRVMRDELRESG